MQSHAFTLFSRLFRRRWTIALFSFFISFRRFGRFGSSIYGGHARWVEVEKEGRKLSCGLTALSYRSAALTCRWFFVERLRVEREIDSGGFQVNLSCYFFLLV